MVQVSMDKLVIEYREMIVGFFIKWYGELLFQNKYKVRRVVHNNIYVFQLHIRLEKGVYVHLFYQNFNESGSGLYTLRLDTRPEYYERFSEWLTQFRQNSKSIHFVSGDIAYDVAVPLSDVVVVSKHMRRKIRLFKETRYYGLPHQRKWDGYCRIYDKRLELLQRHFIEIDGDLTRIEIVYKPEGRIPLAEILHYPPTQSRQYYACVINDWNELTSKVQERIRNWQMGTNTYTRHIREGIKNKLADRSLDFDRLASEKWAGLMERPCDVILGKDAVHMNGMYPVLHGLIS